MYLLLVESVLKKFHYGCIWKDFSLGSKKNFFFESSKGNKENDSTFRMP
jgi:hypothetical protein